MVTANKFSRRHAIIVVLLSIGIGCFGIFLLDQILGLIQPTLEEGLIFPPGSRAIYKTSEFSYEARVNRMGFRDREYSKEKKTKYRVLAIGDSFTYGWGVNVEDAWPRKVERFLKVHGVDAEVANLGSPGGYPFTYANVADRAIPLLNPNLVIIGVLQGDDLAQSWPPPTSVPESEGWKLDWIQGAQKLIYPNLANFIRNQQNAKVLIEEHWSNDAAKAISRFSPEERERYDRLEPKLKTLFLSGNLNPSLVFKAMTRPKYFLDTFDINEEQTRKTISEVAKQFKRVVSVASSHGANVMVASIPYSVYVSPIGFDSRARLGFELNKEMLKSQSADAAIKIASVEAGIEFVSVTKYFRKLKEPPLLYFEFDGHFSETGCAQFASALSPYVLRVLNRAESKPMNGHE